MRVESRLGFPNRERAIRLASAAVVVSLPIAGALVRREMTARKIEKRERAVEETRIKEAVAISQDSLNSGDFDFRPRE